MKKREKSIPPQGSIRIREAIDRLVQLYEATSKKDDAAKWRYRSWRSTRKSLRCHAKRSNPADLLAQKDSQKGTRQFRMVEVIGATEGDLRRQKLRIGTRDLKIAATAFVTHALLLSANRSDFQQVPGLRVENWLD